MRSCVLYGAAVVVITCTANAGLIDPVLAKVMDRAAPDEAVSALVYLVDQADVGGITAAMDAERATLERRHEIVVSELRDVAAFTQGDLIVHLDAEIDAETARRDLGSGVCSPPAALDPPPSIDAFFALCGFTGGLDAASSTPERSWMSWRNIGKDSVLSQLVRSAA